MLSIHLIWCNIVSVLNQNTLIEQSVLLFEKSVMLQLMICALPNVKEIDQNRLTMCNLVPSL